MSKKMPVLDTAEYLKANEARIALNVIVESKGDKITDAELAAAKAPVTEALEALNEQVKTAAYVAFLTEENPVKACLEAGSIDLYGVKPCKDLNGEYIFVPKFYLLDLHELEKAFNAIPDNEGKKLFNNSQWYGWIEALNHAFYNLRSKKMGIVEMSEKLKKRKISDLAAKLEIPSLESKGGGIKALQMVMDAILYIGVENGKDTFVNKYKITSHDYEALIGNYSTWKRDDVSCVVFPTDDTFRSYVFRVLSTRVTGKTYNGDIK